MTTPKTLPERIDLTCEPEERLLSLRRQIAAEFRRRERDNEAELAARTDPTRDFYPPADIVTIGELSRAWKMPGMAVAHRLKRMGAMRLGQARMNVYRKPGEGKHETLWAVRAPQFYRGLCVDRGLSAMRKEMTRQRKMRDELGTSNAGVLRWGGDPEYYRFLALHRRRFANAPLFIAERDNNERMLIPGHGPDNWPLKEDAPSADNSAEPDFLA